MTEQGFDRLIAYLEGAFRERLLPGERDAYWLTLQRDDDATILELAVQFVRGDRARYGFPKPGDILPQTKPQEYDDGLAYTLREGEEFNRRLARLHEREKGFKQIADGASIQEEHE